MARKVPQSDDETTEGGDNATPKARPVRVRYETPERGMGGKREISHASLGKLIARLTDAHQYDTEFRDVFLLTFRCFCSPYDFIKKLLKRYTAVLSLCGGVDAEALEETQHVLDQITLEEEEGDQRSSTVTSISTARSDINTSMEANVSIMRLLSVLKFWIKESGFIEQDLANDRKAQKKLMAFLSEIKDSSPIPSIRRHAENLLLTVVQISRGVTTGSAEEAIKANDDGTSTGRGFDAIIQDTLQRARLTAASRKSARISYDNVEPLSGLSAQELADQLSLMEADQYFSKLNPRELTNKAWTRENKHREAPHVMALIELFDATAEWVSSEILHPHLQAVERAKMITLFIDAADNCYQMNNFNTLFEITTGLSAPCIRQLNTTWSLVSAAAQEKYQCLQQVCSPDDNYRSYRQAFALAEGQPRLACWFILVKDLFTYEEAMKSTEDGLVNWQKFRKIHRVISEALDRQNFNYVPVNSNGVGGVVGASGVGGPTSSAVGVSRKGRGILRHDRKTQIHIRHRIDTIRKDSSVLYQLARNANTQESILFVNSLSEAGFL
ncbi:hypothetical protein BBO99_00003874 [Phytophthora kernoviae]|uniref:Ras-GEF domain-containing protein n=2 Tax=Phytophthora kernoviae TaxID=325452 RepID=A0A3R7GYA9_9STRA|nr:hypothetical protein G195_004437 [Phytophthora kernoviae 00238/432]KAG2526670.1 hypothetical protein JM16_003573 [Phytophthora kernoviae]KAG2528360.1 hypothetical protein JM18_003279 [Phytophthora kernoviae]RLN37382.1 hypothetical protein BBI17_004003 [Phytophthora kernoviae]RLN81246.1 hypothetical protein BBO99_00003874 [Phytophthora kernoviae]